MRFEEELAIDKELAKTIRKMESNNNTLFIIDMNNINKLRSGIVLILNPKGAAATKDISPFAR
ncbi:MAG: hypothetical protein M1381_07850 [Deltaproteobacteria bacterium]|nr:hypothetical protein [Deltaproteobacteria bacterium]MCL5791460.1 hypothetical protein [Deltaproteobacteria bacterium]